MIHIGLCADERYSLCLGVCITSLFESNKGNDLCVHVLTQGFSATTVALLNRTAEKYKQTIEMHKVEESLFDSYPMAPHFPHSIYFRYLLPDILPQEVEKIIYMDCDTIVMGCMKELWDTDMSDTPLAAVIDASGDDIRIRNRIEVYDGSYFNSGVLLMNLDMWRKEQYFSKLSQFILDNPEKCVLPDQDALNVVFRGKTKFLSCRYNYQMVFAEKRNKYLSHKKHWRDIDESFGKIVILHYATYHQKPWYAEAWHPMVFIWRYYKNLSLWRDVPLRYTERFIKRTLKRLLKKGDYVNTYPINPSYADTYFIYKQRYARP